MDLGTMPVTLEIPVLCACGIRVRRTQHSAPPLLRRVRHEFSTSAKLNIQYSSVSTYRHPGAHFCMNFGYIVFYAGIRRWNTLYKLLELIEESNRICAFTGAGISTFCGIPDFRGPNGVYRDNDSQRMFEIDLFDSDPAFFYSRADRLVYGNADTKPGPVHTALKVMQEHGKLNGVITQNIDGLHERAGSEPVYAVHGSAAFHRCRKCGNTKTFEEIQQLRVGTANKVPGCSCGGVYKPDITFFGEMLPEKAFQGAIDLASSSDLILVLGTSLTVQPASSIPLHTLRNGGKMVIVNSSPTPNDSLAWICYKDLAEFAVRVTKFFSGSKDVKMSDDEISG